VKTFRTLEAEHQRTPIRLAGPDLDGAGVLTIAGRRTEVIIATSTMLKCAPDRDGLFDLHLTAGNGNAILLHDALRLETRGPNFGAGGYQERIFPNIVVFDANHLTENSRVGAITFGAEKLGHFFNYEYIEEQPLFNYTPEIRSSLRKLRSLPRGHTRKYDLFRPREVYIVHNAPRILRFRIDDRVYEVYTLLTANGPGWNQLHIRADPLARVVFDRPVTIEESLDRVWEWRRFFAQIAMEQLPFKSITARSRNSLHRQEASLYLPNLDEDIEAEQRPFDFHPGDALLNRWGDRALLAGAMRGWLESEPRRHLFRVNIDGVIEQMHIRSSTDSIMALCAAIDGLSEFDLKSTFSDVDIEKLVVGAALGATEGQVDVSKDRLRGLLGQLRHNGLSSRLALLAERVAPFLDREQCRLVANSAMSFRALAAHGQLRSGMALPKLPRTIEALVSMCVCAAFPPPFPG
jgi:hypothetical protein